MTFLKSWEEFEKAAEKLYSQSPDKVRYTMKYTHTKNQLILKMTNDVVVSKINNILNESNVFFFQCLQFKTEIAQDVRKIDKFINNLMRHMVSKEH